MSTKYRKRYNLIFYKEIIMGILAVISFSLIVYELITHPSRSVIREFTDIDIVIAAVFLMDYIWLVYHAELKLQFIYRNWFLLLASIPIVDSWTEILKALRLLEVVRVLRAGEHLSSVKHKLKD